MFLIKGPFSCTWYTHHTGHLQVVKDNIASHKKDVTMSTAQIMETELGLYCNMSPSGHGLYGDDAGICRQGRGAATDA